MSRAAMLWTVLLAAWTACGDKGGIDWVGQPGVAQPAQFPGWVPIITGSVGGDADKLLLVDTGAPMTLLDRDSFAGLPGDGKHVADVDAFGLSFQGYTVVRFDLFGGTPGQGLPDGIVGGDMLRYFALTLDYAGNRVWLDDGLGAEQLPAGAESLALAPAQVVGFERVGGGLSLVPGDCAPRPDCGTIDVPATRLLARARFEGGAEVFVMIDTGASAVVVTPGFLDALGDAARPRLGGLTVATAGGIRPAELSRVWELELSGVVETDLPIMAVPFEELFASISAEVGEDVVALIGGSFLRRHLVTLDYPASALRLRRYQDQSHVPADEFVGVGFTMSRLGSDWQVARVYTGTDAESEGLVVGNVIDELGGTPITGQPDAVVDALLAGYALGQEVPVGVRGAGAIEPHLVTVEDLLPSYPPP